MNYNEYEEVINGEKTYCSHTECNNKKCRRNQNNYKMIYEYISIADFSDNCGYLEKSLSI